MQHRFAAALAALALLALAPAPATADPASSDTASTSLAQASAGPLLSGSSIKQLFPGRYYAQAGGHTLTIRGSGNGMLEGRALLGIMQDRGRWWVNADQLCVAFSEWLGGKPRCGHIQQQGQWYFASLGGGHDLRFRAL